MPQNHHSPKFSWWITPHETLGCKAIVSITDLSRTSVRVHPKITLLQTLHDGFSHLRGRFRSISPPKLVYHISCNWSRMHAHDKCVVFHRIPQSLYNGIGSCLASTVGRKLAVRTSKRRHRIDLNQCATAISLQYGSILLCYMN